MTNGMDIFEALAGSLLLLERQFVVDGVRAIRSTRNLESLVDLGLCIQNAGQADVSLKSHHFDLKAAQGFVIEQTHFDVF